MVIGTRENKDLYSLSRKRFLSALGYHKEEKKRRFVETLWGRLLLWLVVGVLLVLCGTAINKSFQFSSAYFVCASWLILLPFFLWNSGRKTLLFWTGLDGPRASFGYQIWLLVVAIGAGLLSIYIFWPYLGTLPVNGSTLNASSVLGFSLPIVSATLSGLAIAGANYTRIKQEQAG